MPNPNLKCIVVNCKEVPTLGTEGTDVMCDTHNNEGEIDNAFADFED